MLAKLKVFLQQQFDLGGTEAESDPNHALQLATAALAIDVARADARMRPDERKQMAAFLTRQYGLTRAEAEKLIALASDQLDESVSLYGFTRELNNGLERSEKVAIIELLWQVAWSDQQIDKYEEHYIRTIAELLHVSHSDYIRAKLNTQGNVAEGPANNTDHGH